PTPTRRPETLLTTNRPPTDNDQPDTPPRPSRPTPMGNRGPEAPAPERPAPLHRPAPELAAPARPVVSTTAAPQRQPNQPAGDPAADGAPRHRVPQPVAVAAQPAGSGYQPPTARSLRAQEPEPSNGQSDSPIYDQVRSAWFRRGGIAVDWSSPADEGWRRAAAALRTAEDAAVSRRTSTDPAPP